MNIKIKEIYADNYLQSIIKSEKHKDVEELFLKRVYAQIQALKLNTYNVYVQDVSFSGLFSRKNQVLVVELKKTKIKSLKAFFYLTSNGSVFNHVLYRCMAENYFADLNEKPVAQRLEFIKTRFKSLEERDDFVFFDALMQRLFTDATKNLPE